jgi:uncharacterized membrane protein (UPF0127 family)
MNGRKKAFRVGFRGRNFVVTEYILCDNHWSRARGLMFRKKGFKTPLLFVFDSASRRAIHSFFCRKFLAVWLLNGKIIDKKIVEPWKLSVTPKEKFDTLLEIPLN